MPLCRYGPKEGQKKRRRAAMAAYTRVASDIKQILWLLARKEPRLASELSFD